MASTMSLFMTPEDEVTFFRALAPHKLQVFPEVCEASFEPFPADAENVKRLTDEAYYLHLPAAGDVVLRTIRRGPHAGMLELDEVASPVIHYTRSQVDEQGQLRSARLWSELEVVGDRQKTLRKPDLMRAVFEDIRTSLKKRFQRSKPTGFFIGPHAARRFHEGLVLREEGRKGILVQPGR